MSSNKEKSKPEEHERVNETGAGASEETAGDASCAEGSEAGEENPAPEGEPQEQATGDSSLEEQLTAAKEQGRQHYEKYLRAVADWENYRRRMAREKDELRQYAIGSFIEELLPILDNLELGLQTAEKHPEAAMVSEGFQMVADQIRNLLAEKGLETLDPAGEPFDPHRHESVAYQPDPEKPEGTVISVVRRGYALNGRLLRPASVVVSSGAPTDAAAAGEEK